MVNTHLLGIGLHQIDTPALLIRMDDMEANIDRMAQYFTGQRDSGRNVSLRPHVKTHKSSLLARKQLAAGGASGITCAKLGEAEAMFLGGVEQDILIANQVVGPEKIRRLVHLAGQAKLSVCADTISNIADLSLAATQARVSVGVFVEVNVGLNRCGVDTVDEAVTLVEYVLRSPGLTFEGLQGYEGHLVNIKDPDERRARVKEDLSRLLEVRHVLEGKGIEVKNVDSGGTGTYNITSCLDGITEIQAGSYLFNDAKYVNIVPEFKPALTLLTSVVSVRADRIMTDAGMKSLSDDNAVPIPVIRGEWNVEFIEVHEEHALFRPVDGPRPKAGDKMELVVGHVCTTVNLHDIYYGIRNGRVETLIDIDARGCFR